MADRRRKAKHSRDPLPIGAIRIRKRSRQSSVRMIKVLHDGPRGFRWMNYARFLWEQHHGEVPADIYSRVSEFRKIECSCCENLVTANWIEVI